MPSRVEEIRKKRSDTVVGRTFPTNRLISNLIRIFRIEAQHTQCLVHA